MFGFGNKRYKSEATGREVDWFKIGFSPHKANLSIYLVTDISVHAKSLKKLGNHKTGVGCLYVNKLDDIDMKVLEEMINTTAKTKLIDIDSFHQVLITSSAPPLETKDNKMAAKK